MQVVVNGLLVDYQRIGQGKTLVLLHGWGDSSKGLLPLAKQLAKKYSVIIPDLPGFGASQTPDEEWDLADYADFVSKFIAKLKLDTPLAIIGHSNGGAIAIKGLATNKLEADNLVLLASSGIRSSKSGKLTVIRLSAKAGKTLLLPLPKKLQAKARAKLYKSIGSDLLVAEHLSASFKKVVAEDLQSEAAKLKLPTLLIYGEDDQDTPVSYGRLYHQLIDDSTLEIISGAGHFVHLDKPGSVVKLIEDYL